MSFDEFVEYWVEKAEQDIASARDNLKAGRLQNIAFIDEMKRIIKLRQT